MAGHLERPDEYKMHYLKMAAVLILVYVLLSIFTPFGVFMFAVTQQPEILLFPLVAFAIFLAIRGILRK